MVVQRWRLTWARTAEAADRAPRELAEAWHRVVDALSTRMSGGEAAERPRLIHAAPLPIGMTASAELSDLLLAERWTIAGLRPLLGAALPAGHRLIGLHDVWLGEPSLPGVVLAADYRVTFTLGLASAADLDYGG